MGIKGLTDRGMAFPEIGFIRKGMMEGNRPIDLNYFRVEIAEPESQEIFNEIYIDEKTGLVEPREIKIVFPFNDIEKNWEAWLEAYTAGRMVARSDGEKMIYWVDNKTSEVIVARGLNVKGETVSMPINYKVGTYVNNKGIITDILLKPVGRLKVVLPELQRLAYLTVHTTSYHDIINLSQQLEALKSVNGNRLAGIPLMLRRRPRKISTPGSDAGTKVRRVKWLLSIEADPEWVQLQFVSLNQKALPAADIALLTGRTDEAQDIEEPDDFPEELTDEELGITDGEIRELDQKYVTKINPESQKTATQPAASKPAEAKNKANADNSKATDNKRPYNPEQLKNALEKAAKNLPDATDKQVKLAGIQMVKLFPVPEVRHDIYEYLFEVRSFKDVDLKMVNSILKWLDVTQEGKTYTISDLAGVEVNTLISTFTTEMDAGDYSDDDVEDIFEGL